MQDGPLCDQESFHGLPDIKDQHCQQARGGHGHVGIERPSLREPPVKERRQRPRAAARRAEGEVQKIPPQTEVRTLGQCFGRYEAKSRQCDQKDEEPGNSAREKCHFLFLPKGIPVRIRQFIHGDQDEVNNPPDAAPAERYELQNAETHVVQIEPINSQ